MTVRPAAAPATTAAARSHGAVGWAASMITPDVGLVGVPCSAV